MYTRIVQVCFLTEKNKLAIKSAGESPAKELSLSDIPTIDFLAIRRYIIHCFIESIKSLFRNGN